MKTTDTNNFIETVRSEGCIHIWTDVRDGFVIEHFMSKNNTRKVLIESSVDYIEEEEVNNFLTDLELEDLIGRIYFEDDSEYLDTAAE